MKKQTQSKLTTLNHILVQDLSDVQASQVKGGRNMGGLAVIFILAHNDSVSSSARGLEARQSIGSMNKSS